jgi:hypothetical protein
MALVWNISAKQALTCSALSGMDYHEHHRLHLLQRQPVRLVMLHLRQV